MQISEREDNNMPLEFGDDELLFEDEFIPDNLIPLPNNHLSDGESNTRLEQGVGILRFTQQKEEAQNQNRKTIFILWPVYGWRIAAPQIITRQLDFLQLTSLRLARAGVIRHQDQAELMGQHKDCLWNVMMQLKEQNYLDSNGRLTETGKKILSQEGEEEEERTNYGWIFQEATAGELLPHFYTENLRFADPQRSDISEAFQLPWIRQKLAPPNASNVISTIETYRRLLKRIQIDQSTNDPHNTQADICEFTDISEPDNLVRKKHKEAEQLENFRVRILSQRSQRFYLLVSCTIEGSYDGLFSLRCPFGLPDGFRWVRLLNFATSQCEEGKKLVEHLQSHSREIWKLKQPPHLEPVTVARQVDDKVASVIGQPPDRLWQQVWEEIERVEQSRLLLERGFDEVDTTITRIQRVLEQLMISLLQIDSIPNNIWEAYKRGYALKQCLEDTLLACGITEIPERIVCTKMGAIRNVINGGKDSLRPYVATFLLSASRKSSLHRRILAYLLGENSAFLSDVDQIAQTRNQFGAHAGGSHNEPIILVEDLVEKMYQIVRLVLQAWHLTIR